MHRWLRERLRGARGRAPSLSGAPPGLLAALPTGTGPFTLAE
jgi:hypothetical protein